MDPNEVRRIPVVAKPKVPSSVAATVTQVEAIFTTTTNDGGPLSSLKFFPKLLLELRLMIWKLSLPGKRVVKFSTVYILPFIEELIVDQSLPTPLLHVNRESRAEALQSCEFFAGRWKGRPIYVNYELDTMSFEVVDDFATLCGLKDGAFEFREPNFDADVVLLRRSLHHIEFRTEDFLGYGYLNVMASLESITVIPTRPFPNKIMWQDEDGNYHRELWSKDKEAMIKSRLVEAWTGVKTGLLCTFSNLGPDPGTHCPMLAAPGRYEDAEIGQDNPTERTRAFHGPIYFDFEGDTIYVTQARALLALEKNHGGVESDGARQDVTKRPQHVMLQYHAGRVAGEVLPKVRD
ncbi:hypothetical protein DL98DRAFT_541748 [Cadophora sp. DSE1049]|nr:hypothetical protein DL98DRAFT_541748 [Cadophora sp. DSE1049]